MTNLMEFMGRFSANKAAKGGEQRLGEAGSTAKTLNLNCIQMAPKGMALTMTD